MASSRSPATALANRRSSSASTPVQLSPSDGTPTTPSSNLKRKRPTDPKFYAVRAGHTPGVYLSWTECKSQITGFKGSSFKSFPSITDAEKFLAGQDPTQDPNSASYQPKFYAIASGLAPGVYTDWASARKQIVGSTKPKHRCFDNKAEAEEFVQTYRAKTIEAGETSDVEGLGDESNEESVGMSPERKRRKRLMDGIEEAQGNLELSGSWKSVNIKATSRSPSNTQFSPTTTASAESQRAHPSNEPVGHTLSRPASAFEKSPDPLTIYTDGSSLSNGTVRAIAGVGVYFGPQDARNVSEPLTGILQTNNRAELTAILRALEIAPSYREINIHSDSSYGINCVTNWYHKWRTNGWKTAKGQTVENRDLIERAIELVENRKHSGARTTFIWVKGHSNEKGNEEADRLAVAAARKVYGRLTQAHEPRGRKRAKRP